MLIQSDCGATLAEDRLALIEGLKAISASLRHPARDGVFPGFSNRRFKASLAASVSLS